MMLGRKDDNPVITHRLVTEWRLLALARRTLFTDGSLTVLSLWISS